ncbi:polysaccharide deacetylase family protein [Bizionia argentinensis JUB59]|uniref:Polysaccharide deacetylase family protein n=1 Tax=Bizionia argentinensis JUB59 TaxID=1046627 RepID=G2EF97_9FLAO|nr:polysaccharide deacetylase family protein [Bizionia argentinensis]EGV42878.1 polysaccharide deacetylase family protein [Bizionia argentinensis JUB59]
MLNFKSVNLISIVIFLGLLIAFLINPISIWWFVLLFFSWFTLTAFGSGLVSWHYHIKILNANKNANINNIAITFDDGPNPEFTPQVLALLKQYKAKATFFCIGKHIEAHPKLFKQILAEGHTIGNHTYSHANTFGFFKTEKVQAELLKTNTIIKQFSGLQPKLFRPAFGVTNPRIRQAVNNLNLTTIGWNKRSLDTTNLSDLSILKRVTKNINSGDIILLHDTSDKSVRVLEQLLLFLHDNKFQSVAIDTLFKIKAYA